MLNVCNIDTYFTYLFHFIECVYFMYWYIHTSVELPEKICLMFIGGIPAMCITIHIYNLQK